MAKDLIGYDALTQNALRGVAREALRFAEKRGLLGSHHFYLTFKTGAPGVEMPDFLRERYPEEITIVLQNQFWGLKVGDDGFEVTLTFQKMPAALVVPFAALTAFVDPGVQFGLQFETKKGALPAPQSTKTGAAPATPPPLAEDKLADSAASAKSDDPEAKPAGDGSVVSLDKFRKK